MENKIYIYSLTVGQQGGIGYPPVVIRLEKPVNGRKIYGIDNSRVAKTPKIIEECAIYPRRFSEYGHQVNKESRSQQWTWNAWHKSPRITWNELIEILTISSNRAK